MSRLLRRWKSLIAAVAVGLLLSLLYFSDGDFAIGPSHPPPPPPAEVGTPDNDNKVRWRKLPDHYPVTKFHGLPMEPPTEGSKPKIPKIQAEQPTETDDQRKVRIERLAAVKKTFQFAWTGYKQRAWMADEVKPVSGEKNVKYGGWGATLVDALDTLFIMGLKDEFEEAVKAAETLDFLTSDSTVINVFETTIRYLGGFLAAYELSGSVHRGLMIKAVEIGDMLMTAFDTPTRFPITRWQWQDYTRGVKQEAVTSTLLAEIASLSLEFTKLSQLTGDMRYFDAVQRVMDAMQKAQMSTKLPGMWPISVDAANVTFDWDNTFSLGAMSDSAYEYLPKQFLILGGMSVQPRDMYEAFLPVAKKHLFRRVLNEKDIPVILSGEVRVLGEGGEATATHEPKSQHLTCFVGGMVALAAKIFSTPDDMEIAKQLTNGCIWAYNVTTTGIGPEVFNYAACGDIAEEQTGVQCKYSKEKWQHALSEYWVPARRTAQGEIGASIEEMIERRHLVPGLLELNDAQYLLRPEAIESVFIMWRLTGDRSWQEQAWDMFKRVERTTRTKFAAAGIDDVMKKAPVHLDSMESFWFAETLKYYYLVFAEFDQVDLDKWVLNTEAHALARPHT